MRPSVFIAVFALTSFAAPINRDQPSDRDVGLDQAGDMEARNAEPYIRDHAGNKREAARAKQGGYHRKAGGRRAEDVNTKSDVKRGYTRGQQKRDDYSVDDIELDARAIRDRQRSVDIEAKRGYTRGQQKRGYTRGQQKRDDDDDSEIQVDVEARAIRDRQRSFEEDDVEARAIRDRQRSVEEDDVEARAIRDRQRSVEGDDDSEVDNGDFEEVVARAVKNTNNYKRTSGGFWRNGQRSADPEPTNRTGNSKRDAEAEPINRINSDKRSANPEPINRINSDKRSADPEAESSSVLAAR